MFKNESTKKLEHGSSDGSAFALELELESFFFVVNWYIYIKEKITAHNTSPCYFSYALCNSVTYNKYRQH